LLIGVFINPIGGRDGEKTKREEVLMEIRILGCFGGELPGYPLCSLAIEKKLLLDAGAVTSVLRPSEQRRISAILVTHTHLDHIKDIPFLAANLAGEHLSRPVKIISTRQIIEGIQAHLFNDALWPDFTVLPTAESPALKFISIEPDFDFSVDDFTIRAIPVNHTVPAVGYIVRQERSSILYTGDTGPTERIWEEANRIEDLKAVIVEVSFPQRLRLLAKSSGHMTPMTLKRELKKLHRRDIPILLAHMKPQYLDLLRNEIRHLGLSHVSFLRPGERYRF
jgi:ribonuclease BN (tRNA processing enzyme)